MEHGASFEETARLEVAEETGLTDINFVQLVSVNNERIYGKHYVNIGFLVDCLSGEPGNPEPEKSRNWKWYDPRELPEPMFPPSKVVIDAWFSGKLINEIVVSA